jgi:hypothetical protein
MQKTPELNRDEKKITHVFQPRLGSYPALNFVSSKGQRLGENRTPPHSPGDTSHEPTAEETDIVAEEVTTEPTPNEATEEELILIITGETTNDKKPSLFPSFDF